MSSLEKDRDYREEHFDFIQQHIRRYCLKCILSHLHFKRDNLFILSTIIAAVYDLVNLAGVEC